jgi:hypothetical protein
VYPLSNPSVYFVPFVFKYLWYNLILPWNVISREQKISLTLTTILRAGNKCGLEERKDVVWWQGRNRPG